MADKKPIFWRNILLYLSCNKLCERNHQGSPTKIDRQLLNKQAQHKKHSNNEVAK